MPSSTDRPTLLQFALTGFQKVQVVHPDTILTNLYAHSKDSKLITDPTELDSILLHFQSEGSTLSISSQSWGGDWNDIEVGELRVGTARLNIEKGNLVDFEEAYESWVKEKGELSFSDVSLYAVLHPLYWDKPQYVCTNSETGERAGIPATKDIK